MKRQFIAFRQRTDGSEAPGTIGMLWGTYASLDNFLRFRVDKSGMPGTTYNVYAVYDSGYQVLLTTYTVHDFGR